jgi:hypothetical protein
MMNWPGQFECDNSVYVYEYFAYIIEGSRADDQRRFSGSQFKFLTKKLVYVLFQRQSAQRQNLSTRVHACQLVTRCTQESLENTVEKMRMRKQLDRKRSEKEGIATKQSHPGKPDVKYMNQGYPHRPYIRPRLTVGPEAMVKEAHRGRTE